MTIGSIPARHPKMRHHVSNWSWREAALAVFVSAFVLAGLWAGAGNSRGAGQSPTDELAARGQVVFQRERCFFCHALEGTNEISSSILPPSSWTRSGPVLSTAPPRTDDWHLAHLIDPQAVAADSIMPSYASLPEADLRALIAFVQSNGLTLFPTPGPAEAIPVIAESLETYRAGQRLYQRHCAGCHGEFGNGTGRVGHLLQPEPRDFTNRAWMAKRSNEFLYRVIADGFPATAMPGYRDVLTPTERSLLLLYVRYFSDPAAKQALEQGMSMFLRTTRGRYAP